ncbi:hypothetical protein [Wenjunlia tyrosinilytica]|uniref:Lipoprotein n=1 Tax=Wenjunlia tyrosinilytica TaxID=1544741 RepID=A0A917ZV60_9ACTN|nr:hypothetical protein [Wenjunlia tyrosinilytica]GGO95742.1 hypothetical protein GCM10012280_53640 [Wenjunlia tyrosinilytica]
MRKPMTITAAAVAACALVAGCGSVGAPSRPAPYKSPAVSAKVPAPKGTPLGPDSPVAPPPRVDTSDPSRVALAWARVAFGHDTAYDAGPHDAVLRATRYLTRALAARERRYRSASGPGLEWNTWARHRAWTTARARLGDELEAPDTPTTAYREISVKGIVTGRDGWKGDGPRLTAQVRLDRSGAKGPWRISRVDSIFAAQPPTKESR